jgi:hypothetical protein
VPTRWMKPPTLAALRRRLQMTPAVAYSVLGQILGAVTGPLVMVLIARNLSKEQQGYYYAFASVMAMSALVELGIGMVLTQFASHEFAFLQESADGTIEGDVSSHSRLAHLLRLALKWYGGMSVLIGVGVGSIGYIFFATSRAGYTGWRLPWLLFCVASAAATMMIPLLAIMEGCRHVDTTYGVRLVTNFLGSITAIAGMTYGVGLFVPALSTFIRTALTFVFIIVRYRQFFWGLLSYPVTSVISWRKEVWPFQWRIAVSWVSGYLMFFLFTPIMFRYHGAAVAGQMGMTLALTGFSSTAGMAWVLTRVPLFGGLVAQRRYDELDTLYRRTVSMAIAVTMLGSLAVVGLVLWLGRIGSPYAQRLLPVGPVVAFTLAGLTLTWNVAMATYLRAHKREPLVGVSLVSAVLVSGCIAFFGIRYGAAEAAYAYLACMVLWHCPAFYFVFRRCRAAWHRQAPEYSAGENGGSSGNDNEETNTYTLPMAEGTP